MTLRLIDILDVRSMDLHFTASSKAEAVLKMVDLMGQADAVADAAVFTAAVQAREALSTTGLGEGIAIPHGKSDGIHRPAVAFARSETGIDWASPDGTPAKLIFLIGVPQAQAGDEHLRILAMLARRLVHPEFREALMTAGTIDEVRQALSSVSA